MLLITPAERNVLRLLAEQKPPTEIADCLDIVAADVGSYLTVLFSKMGVSSRHEAVVSAFQRGLLASVPAPARASDR